jgi:hypothetical protein
LATTTDLHELIRALTPSEKRYLRMFAERQGSGDQNYMIIFDLIEQQAVYDEAAVLAQITDQKLRTQFAVQKTYLHKLVLRSLRNFHTESSVDFEIKELLMNVELLFRKDLVTQCLKQLAKAERLAQEHEKYEYLFEVNSIKIYLQLKAHEGDVERLEQVIEEIFTEIHQCFERFENIQVFRQLSHRILLLNRREQQALTPEAKLAYEQIMTDEALQKDNNALSSRAKVYYLQTWFIHYFAHGDYDASYDFAAQMIALMELHAHLVVERPENYINILQNLVVLSTFIQPMEVSLAHLSNLRSYAERFPKVRFDPATVSRVPIIAGNLELHLLMRSGQHQKAAELLPATLEALESPNYRYNLNEGYVMVDIHFKAACIYFITRDYRKALSFVNRIMNLDGLNAQFETYVNARILHVLILLETDDSQLFDYALVALNRYLREKGKLLEFERRLLACLRKADSLVPGSSHVPLLAELRTTLDKLPAKDEAVSPFHNFTRQWLDNRLDASSAPTAAGA